MDESSALLPDPATSVHHAPHLTSVLIELSSPLIIRFLLHVTANLIMLYFSALYSSPGTIISGTSLMAAQSLTQLFANVSCVSILVGMASVMETLGSQYNGAKQYREVGINLQRSIAILSTIAMSFAPLWYLAASAFSYMGVSGDVCAVMQVLLQIRLVSLPADVLRESYEAYLMSLGVMVPPMLGSLALNVTLLAFNYSCTRIWHAPSYEYLGWSFCLANYLSILVQVATSWWHPAVRRTMQPFSLEAFADWRKFMELGIPSVVQTCSEWWAYEFLTAMAAQLGTAAIDAQSIIFQFIIVCFMVPLGIQVALITLVGTALGEGNVALAKKITWNTLKVSFVIELLVGLAVYTFGGVFMRFFSTDDEVAAYTVRAIPFLSLYAVVDGMQGVSTGVLRGAGKQQIGATLNVIAYYCIGLPLAWLFCIKFSLGVNGLVLGISLGTLFQLVAVMYLFVFQEAYIFTAYISTTT